MKLATEVGVFVGLLRTTVIILAFGAVALFDRMSPAIERILAENVITLMAAEEMLSTLARPTLPDDEAREKFGAALGRAKANLTEPAEAPLLDEIEALWRRAIGPDATPRDKERLVESIRALTAVNRASMEAADREADRLGSAGAWSVVLLSLAILGISQLWSGRLEERVVQPLLSIEEVVRAAEHGDPHRRCAERGPEEVRGIAAGLNRLLDLAASWRAAGPSGSRRDRALLEHLLSTREGAWAALDPRNAVVAASPAARARLEGARYLPESMSVHAEEAVLSDALRLVRLDRPPPPESAHES